MVEHDIQKKKKDLENVKKVIVEFEEKMNIEVRQQEKLLRKYIVKILYE